MLHRSVVMSVLLLAIASARALATDLQAEVRQALGAAGLGSTEVGVLIVDLSTGRELARINPDEPLIPASNMKLVTTATALRVLGPDFVFRTELRVIEPGDWAQPLPSQALPALGVSPAAAPAAGRVLVVHGDGDPGFGDPNLLRLHGLDVEQLLQFWVDAVREAGISSLDRLIVDDRVFDREFVHPTWPANQLSEWYCAQVAGLNFYDNCLDVVPEPTAQGQSPRVRVMPAVPFLSLTNRAVTDTADTFWINRRAGTNDLTFMGKIKSRRTEPVNVTVHDPPLLFGRILAHRLQQAGVQVREVMTPAAEDRLPDGRTIHAIQTTLPLVLQRCNKDSQNLFAEALLKRVGRAVTGAPGSWAGGASAVRAFLSEELGSRAAAVSVADGSGMSRENRVTPRVLVGLLGAMHEDPRTGPAFRESLSVGGVDGTLQKRFGDLRGQVLGKSGYIAGVSSLSGYYIAPAADGEAERVVAFSFLFNNFRPPVHLHQVKAFQDQLVRLMDRRLAPAATAAASARVR